MRWRVALAALFVAHTAAAETVRDEDGFSIEIATDGACVVVPRERRDPTSCRDVDSIPTSLTTLGGRAARYLFLASTPLVGGGRCWFGVIRFDDIDHDGLTMDTFAGVKGALRNLTARMGELDVGEPNASSARSNDGIDTASVVFDASRDADAARYTSAFALYFGERDYIVETFTEKRFADVADGLRDRALETIHVQNRAPPLRTNGSELEDAVLAFVFLGFMLVAAAYAAQDVARLRRVKPKTQRDESIDLARYRSARHIGYLGSLAVIASGAMNAARLVSSGTVTRLLVELGARLCGFASAACILVWVHRVVINARALGCRVMTPTMAVTWFFVPGASAYKPYRALSDAASAARPKREAMGTNRLLALFWVSFWALIAVRMFHIPALAMVVALTTAILLFWVAGAFDRDQSRLLARSRAEKP